MTRRLLVALILLLSASTLYAKDPGLLTYDQFLASRGLTRAEVDCIKEQTEGVLNPVNEKWDDGGSVCEVWIKEKVTPAKPLTFKDGNQVYMSVYEWQEPVPRPEPMSGEFVVKQDEEKTTVAKGFKRYVPRP